MSQSKNYVFFNLKTYFLMFCDPENAKKKLVLGPKSKKVPQNFKKQLKPPGDTKCLKIEVPADPIKNIQNKNWSCIKKKT